MQGIITTPASVFSILNDKLKADKQLFFIRRGRYSMFQCINRRNCTSKMCSPKQILLRVSGQTPVTDIAFIQFNSDNAKQVSISIAAPSGKIYLQKQYVAAVGENVFKIPVSALPKGIYYIQLHTNKTKHGRIN